VTAEAEGDDRSRRESAADELLTGGVHSSRQSCSCRTLGVPALLCVRSGVTYRLCEFIVRV